MCTGTGISTMTRVPVAPVEQNYSSHRAPRRPAAHQHGGHAQGTPGVVVPRNQRRPGKGERCPRFEFSREKSRVAAKPRPPAGRAAASPRQRAEGGGAEPRAAAGPRAGRSVSPQPRAGREGGSSAPGPRPAHSPARPRRHGALSGRGTRRRAQRTAGGGEGGGGEPRCHGPAARRSRGSLRPVNRLHVCSYFPPIWTFNFFFFFPYLDL